MEFVDPAGKWKIQQETYDTDEAAQKHLDEMRAGIPDFGGRVVPANTEQEDDLYS